MNMTANNNTTNNQKKRDSNVHNIGVGINSSKKINDDSDDGIKSNVNILPIFPSGNIEYSLDDDLGDILDTNMNLTAHDAKLNLSINDHENTHSDINPHLHHIVTIVNDTELDQEVLEIGDHSLPLIFRNFLSCNLPNLSLNIKNLEKFVTIIIKCKCLINNNNNNTNNNINNNNNEIEKELYFTNRKSTIQINGNKVIAPLILIDSWQYINIDFKKIILNAFGCTYLSCSEIIIHGSTRISKLYFQEKPYSDAELPSFLRIIS